MICLSVYYGLKVFSSALVMWNLLLFVEALETTRDIKVEKVQVSVNGDRSIATVSENFICATLDWWPPEKCDYGTCSWGHSSLLNLDLRNSILQNAVRGLSPLLLRLGGSLQDQVLYNVGNIQRPCGTFFSAAGLFGFSEGCLNMSRWQDLNEFFYLTGSQVAFGLNALYGREQDTSLPWDSSNTQSFIQYTADNLYPVYAWELGNELSSSGVGASLSISQYAADIKELRIIIDRIYAGWIEKPLVVAPDGFFEKSWYAQFLQETGTGQVLDACTHHIYNLGPGISTNVLDTRILDPDVLNNVVGTFDQLQQIIETHGPWAQAWVGESGGAYNSGQHLVSDAFLSSFWYVDQLGMAACFNTQVYCRQSLVGGNYGLLNRTTFQPNPDYYSAFLWKELVGTQVLATNVIATPKLRAYAHCSKGDTLAVTVVLINLSNGTAYSIDLSLSNSSASYGPVQSAAIRIDFLRDIFTRKARKTFEIQNKRFEYHLTAPNGNLHSQKVLLNGKTLEITADGNIPDLVPILADSSKPIQLAPTSIVFVKIPNVYTPACNII